MPTEQPKTRSLVPAFTEANDALRRLAHQGLPGGVEIILDEQGQQAIADTRRYLSEGHTLLYGAAFAAEGLLAVIDILEQRHGKWYAYLVRPSTRMKEWHLVDAALHDSILRQNGMHPADVYLLLLNMQYVRRGALSPQDLFFQERVGRRLRSHQPSVRGRMQMLKRMAAKKSGKAQQGAPQASAPPEALASGEPAALQVDREPLRAFLDGLRYPLYFMDFEAYQTAVPEYDGHWPFRQLPVQFSVHRLDSPEGPLHHHDFIAPTDVEPTAAFGAALLGATGQQGTVLVYNLDSEQLILDQLEQDHPQWSGAISALRDRLVDLMLPFSRHYIRIPSIGNKLSLKYILPALVPHMSFSSLAIGNGSDANQAYNALRSSTDPAFIEATRAALLAYCKVDTLAMVKILERMRELAA